MPFNFEIETTKINDSSYKIKVISDNPNVNGIVDLNLSYKINLKQNFRSKLVLKKLLYVEEVSGTQIGNSNFSLPSQLDKTYITVTVINGVGELVLTSYPNKETELVLIENDLNITGFFENALNFIIPENLNDPNWSNGINLNSSVILLKNNVNNKIAISNAKQIRVEDNVINIKSISEDENWIRILCDESDNLEYFSYPNIIEVIK